MNHATVARVFNRLFADTQLTVLQGGASEPYYQPPGPSSLGVLHYREDFAASALHESAHWCIAGNARRRLADFGYTYQPPPRTRQQQSLFFALELKTQTVEYIFSDCAGVDFQPSADNLDVSVQCFMTQIELNVSRVQDWMATTPDRRAMIFCEALQEQWQTDQQSSPATRQSAGND